MNKKFAESQRRTARRTARRIIVALATLAFDVARPLRLEHEARELRRAAHEEQPQAFTQKRDRFEAAFTAWNQQREGLAVVAALEQTIETIDSPSQALREYVQWTRRYIEHADPIQRFFDALQKDDSAKYYHFERRW
jgi:hypothetical protein